MALGALAITVVPKVTALGVGALVLVFLGFEFALLCMLSIVSEVGAENRGTVISVNAALSTLARAGAAALGTGVYAAAGMPSASLMTLFCCVVAISGVVGARLHNGGQPVRKLV